MLEESYVWYTTHICSHFILVGVTWSDLQSTLSHRWLGRDQPAAAWRSFVHPSNFWNWKGGQHITCSTPLPRQLQHHPLTLQCDVMQIVGSNWTPLEPLKEEAFGTLSWTLSRRQIKGRLEAI
jgi:hypothetical protein